MDDTLPRTNIATSNHQCSGATGMLVSGQASCEAFGKLTAKPQPLWFSPLAALWHLPLPARTLHNNPVDFETGSLTKRVSTPQTILNSDLPMFSVQKRLFQVVHPQNSFTFLLFGPQRFEKSHPYECSHPARQLWWLRLMGYCPLGF